MFYKIKLSLRDEDGSFMGRGLVTLLKGIRRHHSIRGAAKEMGLSYPKALRILRRLEEALGKPVVLTIRGGKGGGGARITAAAQEIVERFSSFDARLNEQAAALFDEIFGQKSTK